MSASCAPVAPPPVHRTGGMQTSTSALRCSCRLTDGSRTPGDDDEGTHGGGIPVLLYYFHTASAVDQYVVCTIRFDSSKNRLDEDSDT